MLARQASLVLWSGKVKWCYQPCLPIISEKSNWLDNNKFKTSCHKLLSHGRCLKCSKKGQGAAAGCYWPARVLIAGLHSLGTARTLHPPLQNIRWFLEIQWSKFTDFQFKFYGNYYTDSKMSQEHTFPFCSLTILAAVRWFRASSGRECPGFEDVHLGFSY